MKIARLRSGTALLLLHPTAEGDAPDLQATVDALDPLPQGFDIVTP